MEDSYGFPSGHVSATTTFIVGLGLLLHWSRRSWALAIAWIAAMALSRMYLGRHFLGDVIGGVAIGLATVWLGETQARAELLARAGDSEGAAIAYRDAVFHRVIFDLGAE